MNTNWYYGSKDSSKRRGDDTMKNLGGTVRDKKMHGELWVKRLIKGGGSETIIVYCGHGENMSSLFVG